MPTQVAASAQIIAQQPGAKRAGISSKKYLVVIAVMLPTIMELLDTSVVNVNLPHIGGSLGASVSEATWVLTSYLIANAIVVPLGGWLSHRFGRRNLILFAITGFTTSSVLCGLAPTLPFLVVARLLQGLTGGGLQPLSQAVLRDEFPVEKQQQAMSFWALGLVLAPTFGPTVGGWITDRWSWHWMFFINVPFGIAAWILVSKFVHDPPYMKDGKAAKMDGVGIALLVLSMTTLQIVFDKGEEEDWFGSRLICWLSAIAFVTLVMFVIRELRAQNPFVKLRLFKDWNFGWGSVIGFLMYSVLFGSIILVPLFMEEVLGWPPMAAGLWTAPRGLGSFIAIFMQFIPGFDKIKSSRWTMIFGFALTGIFFIVPFNYGYSGMNMYAGGWDLFIPQLAQGFAVTIAFMPIVTLTIANIAAEDRTYASALYGSIRNIGSSAGVSFVTIFLDRRARVHEAVLAVHQSFANPVFTERVAGLRSMFMLNGAAAHLAEHRALAVVYGEMLAQANLLAFMDSFTFFGVVIMLVAPLPYLMKGISKK